MMPACFARAGFAGFHFPNSWISRFRVLKNYMAGEVQRARSPSPEFEAMSRRDDLLTERLFQRDQRTGRFLCFAGEKEMRHYLGLHKKVGACLTNISTAR